MFCTRCGTKIERNFCTKCGNKNGNDTFENGADTKNLERIEIQKNVEKYIEYYLEEQGRKTKMGVDEYLNKFNPLSRIRKLCFGIPTVIFMFKSFFGAFLIGPFIGAPIYIITIAIKSKKENCKEIDIEIEENIGEKIFDYIKANKICNELEVYEFYEDKIILKFKNQTYHEVIFDNISGLYKIYATKATGKQALKSASYRPSNILFRNSQYVNPIVKGIIETYKNNSKS